MKLIIIGNTNNFDIAEALLAEKNMQITAGIADTYNDETAAEQRAFLKKHNIKEIQFSDVISCAPDICLILSYSRIIPIEYFKDTILLNIHGGILPKWRGINSNAWALINGEKEAGYSLHKASDVLDGGDIYFIYKQHVNPDQKYGEIIPKLRQGMIENLPDILNKILSGSSSLKPVSQEGMKYVYTPRLRREDGIITDWNKPSEYFYNLYRVMGAPFGTGVFFKYKDIMYEIKEMSKEPSCCDYICIPGAVVFTGKNFMHVKTADNVIKISRITAGNDEININKTFKLGMRL